MVADFRGRRPDQVDRADTLGAGKLAGDDADEFLDAFIQTYNIDFTDFRDYLHYDGNGPPGWFRTSWGVGTDGKRLGIIPVSLTDLLRAAESGRWQMKYPEHRLVNRGRLFARYLPLLVGGVITVTAFWFAWHLPSNK